MREAAITAGLVHAARAGDKSWRERLHIITYVSYLTPATCTHKSLNSEPEAAAVHCAHLTNLHQLKPSQVFAIADCGGGTVVSLPPAPDQIPEDLALIRSHDRTLPFTKSLVSFKTWKLPRCAHVQGQTVVPSSCA